MKEGISSYNNSRVLYHFEKHPARKGTCPSCGHTNVFRYYEQLPREYGKCDREFKCGYHHKPNGVPLETIEKTTVSKEPVTCYPDADFCLGTLNNRMSNFHQFCEKKLHIPETHLRRWNVGTKRNDTETAFIYQNTSKRNVNIVYITYGTDCKRIKSKPPYSLSPQKPGTRYTLCLYGEHLLSIHKIICLVESEKTAVIASFFYPEFDWLATGGKDKLTSQKISVLFNREIYYLIDADKKENGKRKVNSTIKRLQEYQLDFRIIDLFPENEDGHDIADAIIAGQKPKIKPLKIIEKTITTKPIRTARQRMEEAKSQPKINQLVSFLWQTNELSVLFGDTGLGKSILAVAIANSISRGENFLFLENENKPLKVLYYDFELSDKQFEKRYSNEEGQHYVFSDNFYSDNIDFSKLYTDNSNLKFDDVLFEKVITDIKTIGANVLIIDNITYLKTESPQETKIALEIMRRLNELKKTCNLSILVLAHTPKRNQQSPITINDLAGSKHLSNFADSVFAIGKSYSDSRLRYIKQVKPSRSGEMIYDTDNVILCEIIKKDNFLAFDFLNFASEYEHLKHESGNVKEEKKMIALSLQEQGKSVREIASELGLSKSNVQRILKQNCLAIPSIP